MRSFKTEPLTILLSLSRKDAGKFPYYGCECLEDVCKREDLRLLTELGIDEIQRKLLSKGHFARGCCLAQNRRF